MRGVKTDASRKLAKSFCDVGSITAYTRESVYLLVCYKFKRRLLYSFVTDEEVSHIETCFI